ncbi:MAG: S8 family peptidase [Flavobacteriales bacterium]|nr:S8 family peptidase [Flavobacteriales bacterium]
MAKNLPIKLFKKRDNDKLLNNLAVIGENSGGRFKLQGEALQTRSNYFRGYFGGLTQKISRKAEANNYLPTVVKLKINEDALAKTFRGEIGKIFNTSRKVNLIGLIGDNQLLVKIEDAKDLAAIEAKIADLERNALGISAIEEAEDFQPLIDLEENFDGDLKVRLINYGDFKLNEIAERSFETLCEKLGVKFQKLNYTKDLILYRISSIKPQGLTNFNESESIFSIKPMPSIQLVKQDLVHEEIVEIKNPIEGFEYFKIGIFDEGISDIEHLKEWKAGKHVAFPEYGYHVNHGTFIAGIINYGDQLEGKEWTGTKPFRIIEAVVYPDEKFGVIDEYIMVEAMRNAILKFPEVKIWNFSLGHPQSIDDNQYSDFAKFLDELQDEYNVLIVKAAGNCSNFVKAAPRGRITQASESIRTLVVGSIAHEKGEHDLSPVNHPSPFSMVGPGVADVIKPDLVHYGGNAGVKDGKVVVNGVKSFSADGKISKAVGTSYSTPRVAALAAELAGSLKEEFNPLLIKALLVHSSSHPEEFEDVLENRINQIGFGLPTKIGDILFNDPNEVTLILMDAVDKGSHIKIMDFPFPSSLADNGYFYGQIKITLVTAPDVDSYQGAEYIQSDIDVALGTYARKVEVESRVNRNPIDIEDAQNLLLPSLYSSLKQKSASSMFKAERFLKSYRNGYRDQFVPVKKWCIDLEELREATQKFALPEERQWYLKLEAAFRNNFESRIKDGKNTSQEFALIVTIKDTKGSGKVYDEVSNLLTKFNFIHENIKVDERVLIK